LGLNQGPIKGKSPQKLKHIGLIFLSVCLLGGVWHKRRKRFVTLTGKRHLKTQNKKPTTY